jgi:hypothetical protein
MVTRLGVKVGVGMRNDPPQLPQVDYIKKYVPRDSVVMGPVQLFHNLVDYGRYLSFSPIWESRIGAAARKEDYQTFLTRERPVVVIGKPGPGDPEVRHYLGHMRFQEVQPDLWVEPQLLAAVAAEQANRRGSLP